MKKKLLLILFTLFLFSGLGFAQETIPVTLPGDDQVALLATITPAYTVAAPSGCNIGTENAGGTNSTQVFNEKRLSGVFTAGCSGTIGTAYIYSPATQSAGTSIYFAIYIDSGDGVPDDTGDTLVAYGTVVMDSVAVGEWASVAINTGTITLGSTYWILLSHTGTGADTFIRTRSGQTGISRYSDTSAGGPPPANLSLITFGAPASNASMSAYFTVTP